MAGFRDLPDHRARGRLGEDEAIRWLKARGYRIVERNYQCRLGEIDVVAMEGEVLCFVEIKARATRAFGTAIEAVSLAKQRKIARVASWYLSRARTDAPCRFDVLALDLEEAPAGASSPAGWRFQLVRDAFRL